MSATSATPTGLTRDAGWELGVRRTAPITADDAWERLLEEWLPAWLGADSVPLMVGAPLRRGDRTIGRVVGCHVGRRVRVRWTPAQLGYETVFQVTLQEAPTGTTVAIHQERLDGPADRQVLLEHWTEALQRILAELAEEFEQRRDAEPAQG